MAEMNGKKKQNDNGENLVFFLFFFWCGSAERKKEKKKRKYVRISATADAAGHWFRWGRPRGWKPNQLFWSKGGGRHFNRRTDGSIRSAIFLFSSVFFLSFCWISCPFGPATCRFSQRVTEFFVVVVAVVVVDVVVVVVVIVLGCLFFIGLPRFCHFVLYRVPEFGVVFLLPVRVHPHSRLYRVFFFYRVSCLRCLGGKKYVLLTLLCRRKEKIKAKRLVGVSPGRPPGRVTEFFSLVKKKRFFLFRLFFFLLPGLWSPFWEKWRPNNNGGEQGRPWSTQPWFSRSDSVSFEYLFLYLFLYLSSIFPVSFQFLSCIFTLLFQYLSSIVPVSCQYLYSIFSVSFQYLFNIFSVSFWQLNGRGEIIGT